MMHESSVVQLFSYLFLPVFLEYLGRGRKGLVCASMGLVLLLGYHEFTNVTSVWVEFR